MPLDLGRGASVEKERPSRRAWHRCCDHPQLTSFWRQMGQEMQLEGAGRAGVLTIREANARLADIEQNKLQVLRSLGHLLLGIACCHGNQHLCRGKIIACS